MEIYGSKLYITTSNTIYVVDPATARRIRQVDISAIQDVGHIVFYDGQAFISCGIPGRIAVMDTVTLSITTYINLGRPPGNMLITNNKLYVTSQSNENDVTDTVSVVDLTTYSKTKDIIVIPFPVNMYADADNHIYVQSELSDDFVKPNPVPPNYPVFNTVLTYGVTVIDSKADTVSSFFQSPVNAMTVQGKKVYVINNNGNFVIYNEQFSSIDSANTIGSSGTSFSDPLCITVDSTTGEVFVATSLGQNGSFGVLYAFDKTGATEYQLTLDGFDPVKIGPLHLPH